MEGNKALVIKANDTDVLVIAIATSIIPARTWIAKDVDNVWSGIQSEMHCST